MYTFLERDDGFLVSHENGRAVAHVDTKTVSESNNPNLKVQKVIVTSIPKNKWQIHYTGYKLTIEENAAFLKELSAQPG